MKKDILITKSDYFKAGKPIHRRSYCAFLDVLGFTERTNSSYNDKIGDELLQDFYGVIKERLMVIDADSKGSMLYFKFFSDNLIIAHPGFSSEMESEFGFILWAIQDFQYYMALRGYFIRGGLSIGKLFIDDNCVYGEALLCAYELEKNKAVNPIVLLSDEVKRYVNKHLLYYSKGSAPQLRDILVTQEGNYFINYLAESIYDAGDSEEIDFESIVLHKNQINKALKENINDYKVMSKYYWLASYHNYFCDSVSSYSGYSDTFKIDANKLSIKLFRIELT